jgi:hypothetical protein
MGEAGRGGEDAGPPAFEAKNVQDWLTPENQKIIGGTRLR